MDFSNAKMSQIEVKVFSRWVMNHLIAKKSDIKVVDITKDLSNGIILIELAIILTNKQNESKEWYNSPKQRYEMIENINYAIEMFTNDGVLFENIKEDDIFENNKQKILEFVWLLIEFYSIKQSIEKVDPSKKTVNSKKFNELLFEWAVVRIANYPNIKNFQPLELAMCALLDSYAPNKANFFSLDPKNSKDNAVHVTEAMRNLGIPVYLDPLDYLSIEKIDEKVILTQLAEIKIRFEKSKFEQQQNEVPELKKEIQAFENLNKEIISDENSNQSSQSNKEIIADKIVDDGNYYEYEEEEEEEINSQFSVEQEFLPSCLQEDNKQFAGKRFALLMTLNQSDYNNGKLYNAKRKIHRNDNVLTFSLTLSNERNAYLNPAGLRLDLKKPDIENDVFQQFTFGKGEWSTVVYSLAKKGMVWDVADNENLNPPVGTQFYLFPFHGRHNQHFVYKNEKIYAKQNGMVVTYVGGDEPLVMLPLSSSLNQRQTFKIHFF